MEAPKYQTNTTLPDETDREQDMKVPFYGEDAPKRFAEAIEQEAADQLDIQTCVLEKRFDPKKVFYQTENRKSNWTTSHSLLEEEWEGCIKRVLNDRFIAHLYKPRTENPEILEGEFEFESVPSADRHLIKEGMIFYWNIGKEIKKSGTICNSDYLILRRMPSWKDFDIEAPSTLADNFFEID